MSTSPYYHVRPTLQGRWAVVHIIPQLDVPTIDTDCPTEAAAIAECARMNAERDLDQQRAGLVAAYRQIAQVQP